MRAKCFWADGQKQMENANETMETENDTHVVQKSQSLAFVRPALQLKS